MQTREEQIEASRTWGTFKDGRPVNYKFPEDLDLTTEEMESDLDFYMNTYRIGLGNGTYPEEDIRKRYGSQMEGNTPLFLVPNGILGLYSEKFCDAFTKLLEEKRFHVHRLGGKARKFPPNGYKKLRNVYIWMYGGSKCLSKREYAPDRKYLWVSKCPER